MEKPDANKPDNPTEEAFDRIAERYERYVPWKSRLAREIPFLENAFRSAGARRILDCACGPGRHAVALAQKGFEVTALDASPEMLERALQHARTEQVDVELVQERFESLPEDFHGRFDGLICLGNSFSAAPHLETVVEVVRQFHAALEPSGIAITQTVDFSVAAGETVTATPLRHIREENLELLFVKSFVRVEEQICIHWLSLENKDGKWVSDVTCRPVLSVEPQFLIRAFRETGFSPVETLGDYSGNPFQPGTSKDLIIVARR
jgi:2-polyprenyl-3-methyl-5-hydroxy-6-metoxy-1,4-benzoquinol methylase